MTTLYFTKMHGLGNDFMVVDAVRQRPHFTTELIRQLADRHFSIGFDQLLLVEPPGSDDSGIDFRYRIFNADGSEVGNCGNGARCFARFVKEQGLHHGEQVTVATRTGLLTLYHTDDSRVRVDMGTPDFAPESLPMLTPFQSRYQLELEGEQLTFGAVSIGNPHITLPVESIESAEVARFGPLLESHPLFPERVNVGFMQRIDPHRLRLRVFERGSGETLACGTGACAAAAISRQWGETEKCVTVALPGGELTIEWPGSGAKLWMTGPATVVFNGTIEL
ncbi:diaminopimelate epimerase [Ectothiorhodospiraceae bacterium BW-2]|nr:diaminopimelate epimerase [Ectothiorhodospiraceae bacterium BW-2]